MRKRDTELLAAKNAILAVFGDGEWHAYEEAERAAEHFIPSKRALERYLQGGRRPRDRPIEVQLALGRRSRIMDHLNTLTYSKCLVVDGEKSDRRSWLITEKGHARLAHNHKEES